MNNLELLKKEFPKLDWNYREYNTYIGTSKYITIELYKKDIYRWAVEIYFTDKKLSDFYDIKSIFEVQIWDCFEVAVEETKEFLKEILNCLFELRLFN